MENPEHAAQMPDCGPRARHRNCRWTSFGTGHSSLPICSASVRHHQIDQSFVRTTGAAPGRLILKSIIAMAARPRQWNVVR